MADRHRTPARSIRVPDDLWAAVRHRADDDGLTITEAILRLLRRYAYGYKDD